MNNKSEMSDRGFLVLTVALGIGILWLRYKIQIMSFIVNYRIAVATTITLILVLALLFVRKKILSKNKKRGYSDFLVGSSA